MNKKKKVRVLIIQLVVLFLAIIATLVWISSEKEEVTVYDFARTIQYNDKANYQLTNDDIAPATILKADVKTEYVTNKDEILGKYLTGDAYKDSHILSKQLSTDPPYIDKNSVASEVDLRKIYIPITYATAFAGDIKSGDIVDLLFQDENTGKATDDTTKVTSQPEGSIRYSSAHIFMQGLSVYQVYTNDGAVYVRRETDPMTLGVYHGELANGGSVGNEEDAQEYAAPSYVALAVTAQQYEEIASRLKMGTVTLVGRFGGSQDIDTNGYLVAKGDTADIYVGQGTLEKDIELFDSTQKIETVVEIPKLYTFIRDLSKVKMSDEQRQKYASVYTRYSSYMSSMYGTNWESNSPDSITMDEIAAYTTDDEASQNAFLSFKSDLETLAKELRGNQVVLPW
ncbi:hypothetical protein [Hungatella hathewayi]|uniref:hypothetical protein n=1 Tax=Hungatella hathewayi TaxID=154046 RepID=UPI0035654E5B